MCIRDRYKEAEADLDQSIHLSAKNAGNYINRALARFHQNNLRGAMSDYDSVSYTHLKDSSL